MGFCQLAAQQLFEMVGGYPQFNLLITLARTELDRSQTDYVIQSVLLVTLIIHANVGKGGFLVFADNLNKAYECVRLKK